MIETLGVVISAGVFTFAINKTNKSNVREMKIYNVKSIFYGAVGSNFEIIYHKVLGGISMKDKINTIFDYNEEINNVKQ